MMGSDGTNKSTLKVGLFTCFKAEPRQTVNCFKRLVRMVIIVIHSIREYIRVKPVLFKSVVSVASWCLVLLCMLFALMCLEGDLIRYRKLKRDIQNYTNFSINKFEFKSIDLYLDLPFMVFLLPTILYKFVKNLT